MQNSSSWKVCFLSVLLLTACGGGGMTEETSSDDSTTNSQPPSVDNSGVGEEVTKEEPNEEAPKSGFDPLSDAQVPTDAVELEVPFTVQAPFGNWDPPFDEACEESSVLMVEHMLRGEPFTPEGTKKEIEDFVVWQTLHGYEVDITTDELVEVVRSYFGREATLYTGDDVTEENIKKLLGAGYPVIIPAAGRQLGNPYFSGDGPPYHMLVITGWKPGRILSEDRFITNDPGTKRGEDYVYNTDVIMAAIHDWTGSKELILQGKKAMVVIGE